MKNDENHKIGPAPAYSLKLRRLERKGLVVSELCEDGQVRWKVTEKGRQLRLRLPGDDPPHDHGPKAA